MIRGTIARIGRDDLMLAFLNRHERPEFVELRDLPLRMASVCGSKRLRTLSGMWVSPAEHTRASLIEDPRHQWLHLAHWCGVCGNVLTGGGGAVRRR
jgi:hypothetical protein